MCRLWQTRIGFKSSTQLPLFMVWREFFDSYDDVNPYHAVVLFNSMDWIGI